MPGERRAGKGDLRLPARKQSRAAHVELHVGDVHVFEALRPGICLSTLAIAQLSLEAVERLVALANVVLDARTLTWS